MNGRRVVAFVWRFRWALMALLVPVVVVSGWAASRIGIDNAVTVWFVDDDPALTRYREFQGTFGNDEVAVYAVHAPDGVITPEGLARIDAVSRAAQGVDGVVEVTSVTTLDHVRVVEGWAPDPAIDEAPPIEIGPLMNTVPTDAAGAERMRARIAEDPLVSGVLVSDDGTTALVLARMGDFEGMDRRRDGILADLAVAVDAADRAHVPAAGIGVVFSALNVASSRDALVVGGVSYLVIVIVLMVVLGRTGPVLLTVAVVGISALVAVGIYAATGHDLNMVTMALPTLVLIIAVADCVHMLENVAAQPDGDQATRVEVGVGDVLWPCLFTSATTAAGFLSLVTAKMQVVRDLGIYAGIGVMAAYVVSVIVVVWGLQWRSCEPAPRSGRRLLRFMVWSGEYSMSNAMPLLAGSVLVMLGGAWGMSRLQVDTFSIDYFYPTHPVRKDSAFVEASFGPYTPLEFEVVAEQGVRRTDVLGAMARWQDAMEADPEVGWSRSAVGVVRRLNQVLTDGAAASYVVPPDDVALEQALFVYESDPDADWSQMVDPTWTRARVTVGVRMLSARRIEAAIERLEGMADLPDGVRIVPAGYLPLYVTMMDYIVRSQVTSFASAFVLVFGLLAAMLRSARLALIAIPSNIVPLFVTLGLMGITGVRLDVATVTIAAIVLGLVVDDTTHFLYRFREGLHETGDVEEAIRRTMRTAGVALATTTLVLVLGFSVLGLAQVKSVALFGVLSAVAMASALVADLLMLPALLVVLRPKL